MRSSGIAAIVLSLTAAGLFLLLPAVKGAQTFSKSDQASVVFGVS
ncbi:MAG: hypothetical protein P8Z71_04115 [Candidatus Sulfobium sp.]|jgi:hypothetical protein